MKKTLSITLGGLIFNIEDDAYERLSGYLDSIKKHLGEEANVGEIISDIEDSMAEKLLEKKDRTSFVTLQDVAGVIAIMGQVEQITAQENIATQTEEKKTNSDSKNKRFFRNPDDTVIAGVASGLAAYTGIDVVWVRLLFVLFTLISGIGPGIILYLVLWVVVPKAQTSAQKLEMQGKTVSVAEIQDLLKNKSALLKTEGLETINRLKKKDSFLYKIAYLPIDIIKNVWKFIVAVWRFFVPIIFTIVGIFFLIGSVFLVTGASVVTALMLFSSRLPYAVFNIPLSELANRPWYFVGIIAVYMSILIPLIFMVMMSLTFIKRRSFFSVRSIAVLTALWVVGVSLGSVAAADVAPWAINRSSEIARKQEQKQAYNFTDFNKISLNGLGRVSIKQGETFNITFTGRVGDFGRLQMKVENGELQITENPGVKDKNCFLCSNSEFNGEITMPRLDALVAQESNMVGIDGFKNDVNVLAQKTTVYTKGIDVQKFSIKSIRSYVEIGGKIRMLVADINNSHLMQDRQDQDMSPLGQAEINAQNGSFATVRVLESSFITSNNSHVSITKPIGVTVSAKELNGGEVRVYTANEEFNN